MEKTYRTEQAPNALNSEEKIVPLEELILLHHHLCNLTAQIWIGVGPKTREFEKEEIKKILKPQEIKPAETEWAALILFALKKDGTLQFSVEYRKLKAVKKRYS